MKPINLPVSKAANTCKNKRFEEDLSGVLVAPGGSTAVMATHFGNKEVCIGISA